MRRFAARPLAVTAAAAAATLALLSAGGPAAAESSDASRFTARPLQPDSTISVDTDKALSSAAKGADGRVSVIVRLDDEPAASYDGGVRGFPATSARATGRPFDPTSGATVRYRAHLRQQQAAFERAAKAAAPSSSVTARYDVVLGGVAMRVRRDEAATLATLPGVTAVLPDRLEQLQTDASPGFVGAGALWSNLGGQSKAGEGVIVGVLDSGVWPEHPSFSDPDPAGKSYAAPPPPGGVARACEFSGGANPGAAFACNNKLIGADRFMATYDAVFGLMPTEFTTARDDNGHGSHTASTAAGNRSVAASILGQSRGVVSGIAPRAHVMAYKVCGNAGCFQSDSVAAVQKAITDGVDVINFSISGGSNPYADAVELAFLDAYNAGVFVSASAGNSGPGADTVDHRGPWVTTVAASTSNRHFRSTVQLSSPDGATLSLTGSSVTPGISSATPVVLATAVGSDVLCTTPIPAGAAAGKIVVCQRGPGRVLKSKVVADGGGAGMLLYNPTRQNEFTDNHWVPTVHLENTAGESLLTFLSAHAGVTASWANPTAQAVAGDVMTVFSSRGGKGQSLGVSKPDVTAPGLQILAANTPAPATSAGGPSGQLFQSIAGTSMSSPHVAGGAALLAALQKTWTPGQIKSALMTSSTTDVIANDGTSPTTPFDRGSGRIRLNKAGDPGATFDVTGADYSALREQLWKANYPSLYVPSMPGRIVAERTLRNVTNKVGKWKLSVSAPSDLTVTVPSTLTLPANGSANFSITIDGAGLADGEVRHAQITLSDSPGHRIVFPITVVRGPAPIGLTKACTPSTLALGATTSCSITATNAALTDAPVSIVDPVPNRLDVVDATVVGGTLSGNTVSFTGTVPATVPPSVSIAPGPTVAGYLPLSLFGIAPIAGVGDETIANFTVPPFTFGGRSWDRIGVTSNGYAVVGGGTGADVQFVNQTLPDPAVPNNVLAPFWTDLNPGAGGAVRIGTLTDGVNDWIVIDWEGVREFNSAKTASFQIWIGVDGNTPANRALSFDYGPIQGSGDGGFLTVGAENVNGTRGQNTYVDGVGTLPTEGTGLVVSSAAGTAGTRTIAFDATGASTGPWTNCVSMTSAAFDGTSVRCINGTVTP